MASNASLVAFVVEQLGSNVTSKKMFGEYGIYREAQLIALFSDWDDAAFMAKLAAVSATELAARPAKRKPARRTPAKRTPTKHKPAKGRKRP